MSATSPESAHTMSDAEGDAWDDLWDSGEVICTCPSCNYYAPDYEQRKDEPCVLRTAVDRIASARIAAAKNEIAEPPIDCSCGNRFDGDNLCMVSACQWEGVSTPSGEPS